MLSVFFRVDHIQLVIRKQSRFDPEVMDLVFTAMIMKENSANNLMVSSTGHFQFLGIGLEARAMGKSLESEYYMPLEYEKTPLVILM